MSASSDSLCLKIKSNKFCLSPSCFQAVCVCACTCKWKQKWSIAALGAFVHCLYQMLPTEDTATLANMTSQDDVVQIFAEGETLRSSESRFLQCLQIFLQDKYTQQISLLVEVVVVMCPNWQSWWRPVLGSVEKQEYAEV